MSNFKELARPEIRNLRPYRAAQYEDGLVRLNANETPWRLAGDDSPEGLNQYPETRPLRLTEALARHYSVNPQNVLVTRGSSEAIDLLVRCFCRPAQDNIIICPPTFGMYEVYAQIQGAATIHVPLDSEQGYILDLQGIEAAVTENTKLLFICSPNNPTGNLIPIEQIDAACKALKGTGIVVVDAAYIEFAAVDPTCELLKRHTNIIILRTLSKALGLAGIRCGAALAAAEIIDLLSCILPPYSYPTPCAEVALTELAVPDELGERVARLCSERERVAEALIDIPGIEQVLPSAANFLLVRATDSRSLFDAAKTGGISIRNFGWDPYTPNCLRITIGTRAQNDQLLEAL